ncbi:ty1-copia retrotransposon protein [Cucumis melo var. makuwa]|uniref:Ty1-copia retrotransposon protein n=1 Tax=Cucumis melo var. makuwa TaxID=1194695 RepID=A0A5D3C1Q4_CUCMM|nr:ty1-copia retrotransposon protein [Cucumis melo var. makuwa]
MISTMVSRTCFQGSSSSRHNSHLDLPSSDPPATTPTSSDLESSTWPSATVADQVKKDQVIDLEKYAKDNKTVRGHLLNHMSDPMFDLFVAQKSVKDI